MNEQEIFKFFPEPVFKYKLDDFKNLNKELSEYIYKLRDQDKMDQKDQIKEDGTLRILS